MTPPSLSRSSNCRFNLIPRRPPRPYHTPGTRPYLLLFITPLVLLAVASFAAASSSSSSLSLSLSSSLTTSLRRPPEPYLPLNGCNATAGPPVPSSPDPLVRYRWNDRIDRTVLQRYDSRPVDWASYPPSAFRVTSSSSSSSSLYGDESTKGIGETMVGKEEKENGPFFSVDVYEPGTLVLDFGVERAAWFEFDSDDLAHYDNHHVQDDIDDNVIDDESLLSRVTCGLSEFNTPLEGKTKSPIRYGPSSYRLETNGELYEGLRFAFINVSPASAPEPASARGAVRDFKKEAQGEDSPSPESKKPTTTTIEPLFRISDVRSVARVRPVNYTGSYNSSSITLSTVWSTGAYAVRLNMNADSFGSVLVERGDRVAIQGDGHPTMAAALSAFGTEVHDLVRLALLKSDSGCVGCHVVDDTIMAYPLYWTMSVNNYYWQTGNLETFATFVPDVSSILDRAIQTFYPEKPNIVWMGWDDRIDDGWCGPCNDESHLAFASLVVRAYLDFARSLSAAAKEALSSSSTSSSSSSSSLSPDDYSALAKKYIAIADKLRGTLTKKQNGTDWSDAYGLHAAANAINAALPTPSETDALFHREMNDVVRICSFSSFNQYWILQALGNANKMDHALSSVRLCWGGMTRLGRGCFWETYEPGYEALIRPNSSAPGPPSFCHPWSSGVTHWLTQTHAGLVPLSPGYKSVLVIPYVSALYPSVSGSVGTDKGTFAVRAELNRERGKRDVHIWAYLPVKGRVALRRVREDDGCVLAGFRRVRFDSVSEVQEDEDEEEGEEEEETTKLISPLSYDAISSESILDAIHPNVASSLGFSEKLNAGVHELVGVYVGCDSKITMSASNRIYAASDDDDTYAPFPPASYPATISTDEETRGDWVGKYGTKGYVLFGFRNGTDVQHMPDYVRSISSYYMWGGGKHTPARLFRGTSASNATYLQPPPTDTKDGSVIRALGSIGDECNHCRGTVIDIDMEARGASSSSSSPSFIATNRRISLYFVAAAHTDEVVVAGKDFRTRSHVAPMKLISEFGKGVYWSMTYDGGARLRIMPRSGGAAVSAIFFD